MPELSTLDQIADLMVRQALTEVANGAGLAEAIERAYPFRNRPEGQEIWRKALVRHAVMTEASLV